MLFDCRREGLGHCRGNNHNRPMLITVSFSIFEGHQEPRNEVGSLSPFKRLVSFEPETLQVDGNTLLH